ncbi:helix-turn-helix domain-containing protein [Patescibacteria group bacterium]|nr:helix-turn-helix domain-containing protein [Patescibacteria group bacterium]
MEKGDKGKNLLTIGKASEYLGVSIDTLRRWEKKGRIEPLRSPGGHRYFLKEDLDKLFGKRYLRDEANEKSAKKSIPVFSPIVYPTLQTSSEKDEVLERPAREVKIPEINLIRVVKVREEIKVLENVLPKDGVTTSILTPANIPQINQKEVAKEVRGNPEIQKTKSADKKSNYKVYLISIILFAVILAAIFFFIGLSSQEILSPIP